MSANTTPSSVRTLPSIDEDNDDKLIMLWADTEAWNLFTGLLVAHPTKHAKAVEQIDIPIKSQPTSGNMPTPKLRKC